MGNDETLGRSMHFHGFALSGHLDKRAWEEFLNRATEATGMKVAGKPAFWEYPTEDGNGGTGQTYVQPITESFLALDTWPDHWGAYLVVCSCRRFDPHVLKMLLSEYGLVIAGESGHVLRIP